MFDQTELGKLREHRLRRVREKLQEFDVAGIVLFDPVNIRYATGARNMQVWNSTCSGEMRRDVEEPQWRRRLLGPILTLRCESVGSKQD